MKRQWKRTLSILLSLTMIFSMTGMNTVFATEGGMTIGSSGLCEHHAKHTADCGFTEGTPEAPCAHEHTDACYKEATKCNHKHTDDCYDEAEGTATDSEAQEPVNCSHICDEDSGCITEELDCQHEHDEVCGYAPAVPGTPCTFVCEECAKDSGQPKPESTPCMLTEGCTLEDGHEGDCVPPPPADNIQTQVTTCVCEDLCTESLINPDCKLCAAEDADLEKLCEGKAMPLATRSGDIAIDETNFPDDNFRNHLLSQDYGNDKTLTAEEIAGIKAIFVPNQSISELTGIEHFTALETLVCDNNSLTTLDVTANTALTTLNCDNNSLIALDVSENTALTTLSCNYNNLIMLDVSKNPVLIGLNCVGNDLIALDVTANTALKTLQCGSNPLGTLNVSANTVLGTLYCSGNNLTTLDVSANPALETLVCNNNSLTALDVSNNTALTTLYCGNNNLTAITLSASVPYSAIDVRENRLADETAVTGKTISWDGQSFKFSPQKEFAAQIGGAEYDTLTAAFEAVKNGETIKLLNNNTTETITTANNAFNYTLDLNGKTWSTNNSDSVIQHTGTGALTITDTGSGGKIENTNGSVGYNAIKNIAGTLTIAGGTISATGSSSAINNYGTLSVTGGTTSATTGYAIFCVGTATISGSATVTSAIPSGGTIFMAVVPTTAQILLTITGGTVTNTATGGNGYAVYFADSVTADNIGGYYRHTGGTVGRVFPTDAGDVTTAAQLKTELEKSTPATINVTADITLNEAVRLGASHTLNIQSGKTLTVEGDGKITVRGDMALTLGGGTLLSTGAGDTPVLNGLGTNSTLNLNDITVKLQGEKRITSLNMNVNRGATIELDSTTGGSLLDVSNGKTLTVNAGGTVHIKTFYQSGISCSGTLHINGGTVRLGSGVKPPQEPYPAAGLALNSSMSCLKVTGGALTATDGGTVFLMGASFIGVSGATVSGAAGLFSDQGQPFSINTEVEVQNENTVAQADQLTDGYYVWNGSLFAKSAPTGAVTGVTVFPAMANVQKGTTRQFGATVSGSGAFDDGVIWLVTGDTNLSNGTGISQDGQLTVAAAETAGTLTILAFSVTNRMIYGEATVTVTDASVTKYLVTVTGGAGGAEYEAGDIVTIIATVPAGKQFKQWAATGLTDSTYTANPLTFQMPAAAVTLTAVYEDIPATAYTVTFNPNGGTRTGGGALSQTVSEGSAAIAPTLTRSGYTFSGWDKAFSNVTANITVTAAWSYNGKGSSSGGNSGGGTSKPTGTITTDQQKGQVNSLTGIITGTGSGYSIWQPETKADGTTSWKLRYADGTTAAGTMVTDAAGKTYEQPAWEMVNGAWYPFGADGYVKSGMVFDPALGGYFYIDINTGMKTGWQMIDGKWYYFNPVSDGKRGILFTDTWVDGWYVDKNGIWNEEEKKAE